MKRKNVIWCVAGVVIAATAAFGMKELMLGHAGRLSLVCVAVLELIAANSLARLACGECFGRFDAVAHAVLLGASVFGGLLFASALPGAAILRETVGRLCEADAGTPVRFFVGVIVIRLLYTASIPFRLAWEEMEDAEVAEETWA